MATVRVQQRGQAHGRPGDFLLPGKPDDVDRVSPRSLGWGACCDRPGGGTFEAFAVDTDRRMPPAQAVARVRVAIVGASGYVVLSSPEPVKQGASCPNRAATGVLEPSPKVSLEHRCRL